MILKGIYYYILPTLKFVQYFHTIYFMHGLSIYETRGPRLPIIAHMRLGKLATPTGDHVLIDQICLSYFGRRSLSDHSYRIILNSGHRFQIRTLFKFSFVIVISHAPGGHVFDGSNIFGYFCRGSSNNHI